MSSRAFTWNESGEPSARRAFTVIVMPGLSGPDLVRRLREAKPGLKVVFISGYPGSWLDDRGGLQKGEAFLQKPFSPDDLARTIRGLLAPASPGPERQ